MESGGRVIIELSTGELKQAPELCIETKRGSEAAFFKQTTAAEGSQTAVCTTNAIVI